MTLTALTKDMTLFNPSSLIAEGQDVDEVVELARELNREGLYCPHCYRTVASLLQVGFKNAQSRSKHFFHLDRQEDRRECSHYSGESEKHLAAKTRIYEHLKRVNPLQIQSISLDSTVLITEGVSNRKPDILVTYVNGSKMAHEIQISYINSDRLKERTADMKQHGCSMVVWYLYGAQYNQENRQFLADRGIPCYRLVFESGDLTQAAWTLDTGFKALSEPSRKPKNDSCNKNSMDRSVGRYDQRQVRDESNRQANPYDSLAPEDDRFDDIEEQVTHIRKPGWIGRVHDYPWNLPDHIDIVWHTVPIDTKTEKHHDLPDQPQRYSIADLLMGGETVLNREGRDIAA